MSAPGMACRDCGRTRPNRGRGLCVACYSRHLRAGTVNQFPQLRAAGGRPRVDRPKCLDVLDDATWLVEQGGYRWDEASVLAERLGLGLWAYWKALQRARARIGARAA